MGYYIFSYGIKTPQIEQCFGAKDTALQERVAANATFKHYADFKIKGKNTAPNQALVDIIQGNPFDEASNYAYGYALIGICASEGCELPYTQEIKLGYDTSRIEKVLDLYFKVSNFEIQYYLFPDLMPPFPIPVLDDWPLIGLLKKDGLLEIKAIFKDIDITDEILDAYKYDEDTLDALENLKGIIQNIDYCLAHHLDMISFCH